MRESGMRKWKLMDFTHVTSRTNRRGSFIKMKEITFIKYKRNNMWEAERPSLLCHKAKGDVDETSVIGFLEERAIDVKHEELDVSVLWRWVDGCFKMDWGLRFNCVLLNIYNPSLSWSCMRIVYLVVSSLLCLSF